MSRNRTDRPGYQRRKRADGTFAQYWNPNRASSKAPKLPLRPLPNDLDDEAISALCRRWTDEMLADLEEIETGPVYEGTIASLIKVYMTNENSPYQALKHPTKIRDYQPALRLIRDTVGKRAISNLKGDDFRRWYKEWGTGGKTRRAHGAIRKLRSILSYGTEQRLAGCGQAREILSLIRFEMPAARFVKMEYAHAKAICDMAIELKRPSIALTQAIQWDTALRRIHIIGEWLPLKEGEEGGIVRGRTKWRGPTAADVSNGMIFTPPYTSAKKRATSHDLTACPLVQHVLNKMFLPKMGPLIINEDTNLPWRENYFAHEWRKIATAAGVPSTIRSMDTRAGAISEAEEATGSIDAARKLAGHSDVKTTLGYVRNDEVDHNRKIAEARANFREVKRV